MLSFNTIYPKKAKMNLVKLSKLMILLLTSTMIFSAAALAGDIENSRLMPEEKVSVYQDDEKIADYSKEMPVPEGKLLAATGGKCAVRLDNTSFIAEDQARFAIESDGDYRYLSVVEGTVYFGLTDKSRSMVFLTPKGAVSNQQVMISASSGNRVLEGYVKVAEETSEMGVLNGGSMILATADGQQKLDSGQSMLLAQAEEGEQTSEDQTPAPEGWWGSLSTAEKVGAATIGAIGIGGAALVIADDDDDDDASPSNP